MSQNRCPLQIPKHQSQFTINFLYLHCKCKHTFDWVWIPELLIWNALYLCPIALSNQAVQATILTFQFCWIISSEEIILQLKQTKYCACFTSRSSNTKSCASIETWFQNCCSAFVQYGNANVLQCFNLHKRINSYVNVICLNSLCECNFAKCMQVVFVISCAILIFVSHCKCLPFFANLPKIKFTKCKIIFAVKFCTVKQLSLLHASHIFGCRKKIFIWKHFLIKWNCCTP